MWKKIFISALVSVFVFGSGGIESTWAVRPLTQGEMEAAVGGSDNGGGGGGTPTNTRDMAVTGVWCYNAPINPFYGAPCLRRMGGRPNRYPYGGWGYCGFSAWNQPVINTVKATVENKGGYNESKQVTSAFEKCSNSSVWGTIASSKENFRPKQTRGIRYAWDCAWLDFGWYNVQGNVDSWSDDANWDNNNMWVEVSLQPVP